MTRPMHRNRTFRRVFRKAPGGRVVLQHKRRAPKGASCGKCGSPLAGVPRALPVKMENMPKTMKRPERPYGGVLCSACTRRKLITAARKQ